MAAEDTTPVHRLVDRFLTEQSLPVDAEHVCPYLPDRAARNEGFAVERLESDIYAALMDRTFRRSGVMIYRPACESCDACRPLRVPVEGFTLSRSQRRVWGGNSDVRVQIETSPKPTRRKWELFSEYIKHQHDDAMSTGYDDFLRFLYSSPTETWEFGYHIGRQLAGISIVDCCPNGLSTVYMFFDPRQRSRSLGTYSVLWEIDYCRRQKIPYYYLGYYVAGSGKMNYKANFKPCELLGEDLVWRTMIAPRGGEGP